MSETCIIDCAWTKPAPNAVKAAGYRGVIGYISHDATKDMSATHAKAYTDAGLVVGLVFETTASRATSGKAGGAADRQFAEQAAKQRGYPAGAPIFYAVDGDFSPTQVQPYFQGLQGGSHPVGVYGSIKVCEAMVKAGLAKFAWQTEAWSGASISGVAHLYQRTGKTLPAIAGVKGSAYDEDAVLKRIPLWGGALAPPSPPPTTSGLALITKRAALLVTRRMNHRKTPLNSAGKAVLINLRTAVNKALALK